MDKEHGQYTYYPETGVNPQISVEELRVLCKTLVKLVALIPTSTPLTPQDAINMFSSLLGQYSMAKQGIVVSSRDGRK